MNLQVSLKMEDYLSQQVNEILSQISEGLDPNALDALCASNKWWRDLCTNTDFKLRALKKYFSSLTPEERDYTFEGMIKDTKLSFKDAERLGGLLAAFPELATTKRSFVRSLFYPIEFIPSNVGVYTLLKYGANPNEGFNLEREWQFELFFRFGAGPVDIRFAEGLIREPSLFRTVLNYNALITPNNPVFKSEGYSFDNGAYPFIQGLIEQGWMMDDGFLTTLALDDAILYLALTAISLPLDRSSVLSNFTTFEYEIGVIDHMVYIYNTVERLRSSTIYGTDKLLGIPYEVLIHVIPLPPTFWVKKYQLDFGSLPPEGIDPQTAYLHRYIKPVVLINDEPYTLSYDMGFGFCVAMALLNPTNVRIGKIKVTGKDLLVPKGRGYIDVLYRLFGLSPVKGKVNIASEDTEGFPYPVRNLADTIIGIPGGMQQALPSKNFTIMIRGHTVQFDKVEFLEGIAILCKEAGLKLAEVCKLPKHWIFD